MGLAALFSFILARIVKSLITYLSSDTPPNEKRVSADFPEIQKDEKILLTTLIRRLHEDIHSDQQLDRCLRDIDKEQTAENREFLRNFMKREFLPYISTTVNMQLTDGTFPLLDTIAGFDSPSTSSDFTPGLFAATLGSEREESGRIVNTQNFTV